MSAANLNVVERLLDAFNAKDLGRFTGLTTDDFLWSPSMVAVEGEVFTGPAGIATYFDRMADGWDIFLLEDGSLRDLGDRVLWTGRLDGRGRISGALVSAPLDIIYEVRDGKVASMRSFLDRDEALKAAGLAQ